ncbi:WD40 repeat domain-containing protein [Micromonospora sp. NPDC047467]|uniref:WD40 repeat domain-containing protein n=1 Tax=Micromonospora sp. NPDC047467 TaxID=3154814 RepID=UPI0033E5D6FD
MRPSRRPPIALQLSLLIIAVLLEIAANFFANADTSPLTAGIRQVAGPALIVLLVVLIVGNGLVLWWQAPRSPRPTWRSDRSPYPGLSAFTEQDASVFFGRDEQVTELVRRLHELGLDASARFVCVTGASGSGKSSLVHAGIVPRLREGRWQVLPAVTPAGEPLGVLADLAVTLGAADRASALREVRSRPDSLARHLTIWRARKGHRHGRVLLILDQLEELITLSSAAEQATFLEQIATALDADRRLWVVATLRVEFLADLLAGLRPELFANPVALGTMRSADLVAVVEQPAQLAGLRFEDGLVDQIVADTATPDALPLLAYLLQELHRAAGPGQTATRQAYQALGGVAGALGRQADGVMAEVRRESSTEDVLDALLRLVAMEGAEPTRRRVPLRDLSDSQRRVVAVFTDARLLTTDVIDGEPYAQVAHEALFRRWAPLRQQVEARAEQLRRRTELERWAADWVHAGRSADYLLTGERLELAGQWLEAMESAGQDSPAARALVNASRSRDAAFLHRVSETIGQFALGNVDRYPELAVLLTSAALQECPPTPVARRALMAALAFSHTEAVLAGHTDAVRGVAWSPDGAHLATASRDGTARIWHANTGTVVRVLRGHTGMVDAVDWSPDATQLATASRDGTVRVWDAATAETVAVLPCGDVARGVTWSPDGSRLAGSSRDRTVQVWDTATWELAAHLVGHEGDVWGLRFAPDSRRLASASHDRSVIVWDLTTAKAEQRLTGHGDFVEAVAWSPDGSQLVTGSGDQTVRIWDLATGATRHVIGSQGSPVWSVAWSPDGRTVVIASGDGSIRAWDVSRLREVAELRGHSQVAWSVALSPDGRRVLSGSGDGTARLWTIQPHGAEHRLLAGHDGPVTALALDRTGRIVTGGADGTVRTWQPDGTAGVTTWPEPVVALACSPTADVLAVALRDGSVHLIGADGNVRFGAEVESLAWSPDGSRLAAGCKDNAVRVWDVRTGSSAGVLRGHADWVGALAWSPSGRYLASGSDDRTVHVWDIEHPGNSTIHSGHQNYVDAISWAPNESRLATCSADWTIRVWDLTGTNQPRVLTGHDKRVRAVAWAPDGQRLASSSDDRTVRIWGSADDNHGEVIGVHRDGVTSLAWLPDGRTVVTGSTDGTARVWEDSVDLAELTAVARSRVFRALSEEERQAHLLPGEADS